jgi:hypothetical protein
MAYDRLIAIVPLTDLEKTLVLLGHHTKAILKVAARIREEKSLLSKDARVAYTFNAVLAYILVKKARGQLVGKAAWLYRSYSAEDFKTAASVRAKHTPNVLGA